MQLEVTWTGASGQSYRFETYTIGTKFNSVSGVYIACKRLVSGNFEALYIGETESFYDRLNAGAVYHDGLKSAARSGMTHIGALVVTGNAQRIRVETDLRHGLNPSCNKQNVPHYTSMLRR